MSIRFSVKRLATVSQELMAEMSPVMSSDKLPQSSTASSPHLSKRRTDQLFMLHKSTATNKAELKPNTNQHVIKEGKLCQVDWCTNLTEAKQYYRRDKLCEVQAKASAATVADAKKRFCQQCSRFHELSEFDEPKRSSSGDSFGEGSGRRGFNGKHETSYDQLIIQATTDKINTLAALSSVT